jgi:hypothetical protein
MASDVYKMVAARVVVVEISIPAHLGEHWRNDASIVGQAAPYGQRSELRGGDLEPIITESQVIEDLQVLQLVGPYAEARSSF